jgi:hypothetical protein
MRTYGYRATINAGLREAPPPGMRMTPLNQSYHRRLDDAMVAIFERACRSNNLDSAADVLEVLITWHRRRSAKYGRERRINDDHLKSMLAELQRLTSLRRA